MDDRFSIVFIEVDPYFDTIAECVGHFRRDESKAIDHLAFFEGFSDELEGEIFIDFLLVRLDLRHLEDKPSSLLVLLILPFRLDPLPEKLNRVYPLHRTIDLVSTSLAEYPFCR